MKKFIAIILGILAITSCTKVIQVDLNEANTILVIEANYTAEDSSIRVLITQTANYFSSDPQPVINDATVTITDHLGNVTIVPFIADGNYELTNYIPLFGTSYNLTIVQSGVTYTADCIMNLPISQLPILYEFTEGFFGSKPGYLAFLSYKDPVATVDHFMAILSKNGKPKTDLDDLTLADDQLTNGNSIIRPLFAKIFDVGDTIGVELRTIDKNVYQYYVELQSLTDPSSAAPANPEFQWTNNALGYFSAYSNSRQEVIVVE